MVKQTEISQSQTETETESRCEECNRTDMECRQDGVALNRFGLSCLCVYTIGVRFRRLCTECVPVNPPQSQDDRCSDCEIPSSEDESEDEEDEEEDEELTCERCGDALTGGYKYDDDTGFYECDKCCPETEDENEDQDD